MRVMPAGGRYAADAATVAMSGTDESSQLLSRTPHVTVVPGGGGHGGGPSNASAASTSSAGAAAGPAGDGGDSTPPASTSGAGPALAGPYLVRAPTVTVEAAPNSNGSSSSSDALAALATAPAATAPGRRASVNPLTAASLSSKPVLIRQDCTTFLHSSGGLGYGLGGSEESATSATGCAEDTATRSVPDLELHCRLTGQVSHAGPRLSARRVDSLKNWPAFRCGCATRPRRDARSLGVTDPPPLGAQSAER